MIDTEKIAYERAKFARDILYLQSMAEDAVIQESMTALDRYGKGIVGIFESSEEEDPEIEAAVKEIPADNTNEEEEIRRILTSDRDMTIDDVMGITDDIANDSDDIATSVDFSDIDVEE